MQLQITVRVINVYGCETVYPACDKAKLFAKIAGTKTLVPAVLGNIKALGYEIEVIPTKLPVWS